jgi:hypothetical protein
MPATLLLAAALAAAPGDSTAVAALPSPSFTITGVSGDPTPGTYYLQVSSAADLDGDGLADDGYLKLVCTGADLASSSFLAREAASGMASGKRMHKPVTFVKEWGKASPQLASVRPTYDVKASTKARTAVSGDPHENWSEVALAGAPTLCADAAAAAIGASAR